jgi:hypothetical protein
MRPQGGPEELERRRCRAVQLLREGLAPVEVARMVGVDRRSAGEGQSAAGRRLSRAGGIACLNRAGVSETKVRAKLVAPC